MLGALINSYGVYLKSNGILVYPKSGLIIGFLPKSGLISTIIFYFSSSWINSVRVCLINIHAVLWVVSLTPVYWLTGISFFFT